MLILLSLARDSHISLYTSIHLLMNLFERMSSMRIWKYLVSLKFQLTRSCVLGVSRRMIASKMRVHARVLREVKEQGRREKERKKVMCFSTV